MGFVTNKKKKFQAVPPETIPLDNSAFANNDETAVYWLTSSGILVNSHGTTIMIDPHIALYSDDPPISEVQGRLDQLTMPPIRAHQVKKLDAVLITHADEDHLGEKTVKDLLSSGAIYHGTPFVGKALEELGIPKDRICVHPHKDRFTIGNIDIEMTAAYHPWTQDKQDEYDYIYKLEDCCGYKLHTQDGIIWEPGDTLLLDEHFNNTDVDLMCVGFEDDTNDPEKSYHFGRKNIVKLVNHMIDTELIIVHWGTFYGPDLHWCNCNPDDVRPLIDRPERFHVLAAGEKYILKNTEKTKNKYV